MLAAGDDRPPHEIEPDLEAEGDEADDAVRATSAVSEADAP
jgi:hypothetical protein